MKGTSKELKSNRKPPTANQTKTNPVSNFCLLRNALTFQKWKPKEEVMVITLNRYNFKTPFDSICGAAS